MVEAMAVEAMAVELIILIGEIGLTSNSLETI